MWIFDSYFKGCVELWDKETRPNMTSAVFPACFYMHLKDPHSHREMIDALESRYKAEECEFRTIYGLLEGYRVYADRSVAEKVEKQTNFAAELYNVDIRQDQRYMAERDIFPCGHETESRFSPDFDSPLSCMELRVAGDPSTAKEISCIEIIGKRKRFLEGSEGQMISDLLEQIKVHDPDVILAPFADTWIPLIIHKTRRYGIDQTISRSGFFKSLASRSYWSYGKVNYKSPALIPEGRILIDTARSFVYGEGGTTGVLMASRLTGLSPNLTSRFTPGTLISSYEVFEALRRGIAIPFRKRDAEGFRGFRELKACDKGGMIFQPEPGVYEKTHQIDFTSLYPTIIVKYNLSPETLEHSNKKGFLSSVLLPLLNLRIETKRLKKVSPKYVGLDSVLKWMLVTCFGYTGYRNAKFGQIEVHEKITGISRELLLQTKELAERLDFEVLHGIVDCIWVKGEPILQLKELVERETGILTEVDSYDWIVFLPMADGFGAYNRYFGRLDTGKMKIRGVMARRGDTPEYICEMQQKIFEILAEAGSIEDLGKAELKARKAYGRYFRGLEDADAKKMAIHRRASRLSYSHRCTEASAVKAYLKSGISLAPGMEIGYVVRDADKCEVDLERNAVKFDTSYYGNLLEKAWKEVAFVFNATKPRSTC